MRRTTLIVGLILVVAGFSLVGQTVSKYLSNFDVINFDECCYDDFEIYFGSYDCSCFIGWYPGWGTPPTITPIPPWNTCLVRWQDPRDCVEPGEQVHFGLYIDGRDDCIRPPECMAAYWTVQGVPVKRVPIPFQYWNVGDEVIVDIVDYNPQCCPPGRSADFITIDRWFAVIDDEIPLEQMMWDEIGPESAGGRGIGWEPFLMGEPLYPGSPSEDLVIPISPGQSALVAIAVRSATGEEVVRILNQAVTR